MEAISNILFFSANKNKAGIFCLILFFASKAAVIEIFTHFAGNTAATNCDSHLFSYPSFILMSDYSLSGADKHLLNIYNIVTVLIDYIGLCEKGVNSG
jgi:hypothetical protein